MDEMNTMHCESVKEPGTKEYLANQWTLELTPATVENFEEYVFPGIEDELRRGTRIRLPDGRIRFAFLLDNQRSQLLKQALYNAIEPSPMN